MSDLPVGEVTTLSELLCASPQRVTVAGTARLQLEAARLCDELEAMTNERDSLRAALAKREAVAVPDDVATARLIDHLRKEKDDAEGRAYIHFQCEEEQGRMYEEIRHAVGVADVVAHEEAVKIAAALAGNEVTENLVAFVGRLSYALRKANPANGLPAKALSYLEGAGFKFHIARGADHVCEPESHFAEAARKLEITATGHAVGADKSGDRYQIGFARGFHACWKQFAELLAASQQSANVRDNAGSVSKCETKQAAKGEGT